MLKTNYIVHVDMDAFFASIEQRDDPRLRGRPVVVGADPRKGAGRGVVSACSYEARKFGIHSAMPISTAYRRCPTAAFLSVDMEKYQAVSRDIYRILCSFTPDIEPISIDEAFLDITGSYHLFGSPIETCISLKSKIKNETGLTSSVGLAPTKMAAKIASDLRKPDGFVEVKREDLLGFLWPLDVRKIWGLGAKTAEMLNSHGIYTIGDLAKSKEVDLIALLGKNGLTFWRMANGVDDRRVESETETKSISNEFTFERDTSDQTAIEGTLMTLCDKVSQRLRLDGLKAGTVTLKIRFEGFQTYTRSAKIAPLTNFTDTLYKNVRELYNEFSCSRKKVRLLGVKAANLESASLPRELFESIADNRIEGVHCALDRIRNKFGTGSIYRASSMN